MQYGRIMGFNCRARKDLQIKPVVVTAGFFIVSNEILMTQSVRLKQSYAFNANKNILYLHFQNNQTKNKIYRTS